MEALALAERRQMNSSKTRHLVLPPRCYSAEYGGHRPGTPSASADGAATLPSADRPASRPDALPPVAHRGSAVVASAQIVLNGPLARGRPGSHETHQPAPGRVVGLRLFATTQY